MASASAVECTATVGMPSSLQARRMRSAISPRLAIRIFSNIGIYSMIISGSPNSTGWASSNRIWTTRAGARRRNQVHRLHRLDDEQRVAGLDHGADLAERLGAGFGRPIGSADHRRSDDAGMLRRDRRRMTRRRCDATAPSVASAARRHGTVPRLAGDADPQAALLDLDLGQSHLVEQARQRAHHLLIDSGAGLCAAYRRRPPPAQLRFALIDRGKPLDRERIAVDAEPAQHRLGGLRHVGMLRRNSSRAWMLVMWTSMVGTVTAATASRMAIEVWV